MDAVEHRACGLSTLRFDEVTRLVWGLAETIMSNNGVDDDCVEGRHVVGRERDACMRGICTKGQFHVKTLMSLSLLPQH